jgi:hypothetical protein
MLKLKVYFIFLLSLSFLGCRKDKSGKGGLAMISGYVEFSGNFRGVYVSNAKIYSNATVYLKYGATSFPGADITQYDTSGAVDAHGNYGFGSMFEGNYYLYAVGNYIDPQNYSYPVTGGIQVNINNRKANLNYDIAVTQ